MNVPKSVPDVDLTGPLASLAKGKISAVTVVASPQPGAFGGDGVLSVEANVQLATRVVRGLTCRATSTPGAARPPQATGFLQWCAQRPYTGARPGSALAWVGRVLPQITTNAGFSRVIGKTWLSISPVTADNNLVGYQLRLTGIG